MSSAHQAILLLAHGTPDSPADLPEYMRNITGGRPVPDSVMQEVKHRYALIGHSPLTDITLQQASALQKLLSIPVYVGMRNWRPFIADTVKRMQDDGMTHVVAICLAPQNSRTSVGLYQRAVLAEAGDRLHLDFVDSWHDHAMLIKAFAEKLSCARDLAYHETGSHPPVIFTAHSVPGRAISPEEIGEGDRYEVQARETAALVAKRAGVPGDAWRFAFQSQGMSGGDWLGPTVEETITALSAESHRCVLIQPVGFVCDHVEVLYDIDISFKDFAAQKGMKLFRAESLNTSPDFIAALADIARTRLPQPASIQANRK